MPLGKQVGVLYQGSGSTTYAASTYAPTNAGTYAVTATIKERNFQGTSTQTLTVAKANQETKSRPPGQERLIRGAQETLKKATSPETKKAVAKSVANTLSRGVLSAWEGHKSAMEAKKKGEGLGKQLSKGAGAALGSFMKKGTSQFKECIEYLVNEGYDLSEITLQDLYEELETLDEKAVSEQQQKLFGLALSVKRGQTPRSEASDQVLKMVDTMSEKELRKFAKTKHEDVPVRVKEGISYEDLIKYIRKGENQ
jgi:PKD repeat protein